MYLTQSQRNLIESKSLVHVSFSPIKEKEGTLGYSFKDKFYYRIRLDESIKDNEAISMSILIHELGHVELGHMDESLMDAIKYVFKIAEELGISKEIIRLWNRGPMGVINICMDLEVNDKFLTRQNIRDLTNSGFTPVTLEVLNLEPQDSWKDYIKPYLSMMKDNYDDLKNQLDDLFKSLKDIGEMQTKRNKGSGKSKGSPQEEEDTEESSLGNMNSDKDAEKVEEGESSTSDSSNDSEGEENEVTQSDMEDDGEDPEEYLDEEGELGELITTSDQNCDD